MRFATIITSISVIVSLNLILFLGATVRDMQSIRPLVNGLVMVIDVSLVTSGGLLGYLFYRRGDRLLSAAFSLNPLVLGVAYALGLSSGFRFPLPVLYAADLYWLNLYLVCLPSKLDRLFSANP